LYAGDTCRDTGLNRTWAPVPNTQSREVNLTKRLQAPEGMRYCPIVLASNGRIRPDLVLINGRSELHRGIAKKITTYPSGSMCYRDVSTTDFADQLFRSHPDTF